MTQPLLQTALGQKLDRTPIWLMRQAGRYLEEYQDLRETYSFLELCKQPTLAVRVSLEPYERFGMDGVILFSDIMIPAEAMGLHLDFVPGPVIENPIRSLKQILDLTIPDPKTD